MEKGRGRPPATIGAWNGFIRSIRQTIKFLELFQERYQGIEEETSVEIGRAMRMCESGKSMWLIEDLIRFSATTGGLKSLIIKKEKKDARSNS